MTLSASQAEPVGRPNPVEMICETAVRVCRSQFGVHMRALVLTGSAARGEASFISHDGRWKFFSDAEFLLIVDDATPLASPVKTAELQRIVEVALADQGIDCLIGISLGRAASLRRMRPCIFTYELRVCGQVIYGDQTILSRVPAIDRKQIPPEDGWHLVCNRVVELLGAISATKAYGSQVSQSLLYPVLKLYLDLCTSVLVFSGNYEPSYRARVQALESLATGGPAIGLGGLNGLVPLVQNCTQWKLSPTSNLPIDATWSEVERALSCAAEVWRWELQRLQGGSTADDIGQLTRGWMHSRSLPQRVRGWAHIAIRLGWKQTFPRLMAWIPRVRRGSPRYWLYAATADLLPFVLVGTIAENTPKLAAISRSLPIRRETLKPGWNWKELGTDIYWNYHNFIADTTS